MKNTSTKLNDISTSRHGKTWKKVLKYSAISVCSVILLAIVITGAISLYLTPARLSKIVNEEGSWYLDADIDAEGIGYTIWSTFPNLEISVNSLTITSRTLDNLPPSIWHSLPDGYRRLFSATDIKGGVNILKALKGEICLTDISMAKPTANIVIVNDSLNNYDIFPKRHAHKRTPHISLNTLDVKSPLTISFSNLKTCVNGDFSIDKATVSAKEDSKEDTYTLSLSGFGKGSCKGLECHEPIPFDLDAVVAIHSNPLVIDVTHSRFSLPGITAAAVMNVLATDNPVVRKLDLQVSAPDAIALMRGIPSLSEKIGNSISGALPIDLHMTLLQPVRIGTPVLSSPLPQFTGKAYIPHGRLSVNLNNKPTEFENIILNAEIMPDPADPTQQSLSIRRLHAATAGSAISLTGEVSGISGAAPALTADIKTDTRLSEIAGLMQSLFPGLNISGKMAGDVNLACSLADIKEGKLTDVAVKGTLSIPSLKATDGSSGFTADVSGMKLSVNVDISEAAASEISLDKILADIAMRKVAVRNPSDSSSHIVSNALIALTGHMAADTAGTIRIGMGSLASTSPSATFNAHGINTRIGIAAGKASPANPASIPAFPANPVSADDSLILNHVAHSTLFIPSPENPILSDLLQQMAISADLKIKEGDFDSRAYPAQARFCDVSISTNLDTLSINNARIAALNSEAAIKGKLSGLANFLTSSSAPAPLSIDMDADFSNVDINALSGAYYRGQENLTGKPADYHVASPGAFTAADSLCVLIPRNILANVRLHSDKAQYMGWQFSPLSTEITVHDGVARLGHLRVGAPYGNADVDWTYSTADLGNIFMELKVKVDDFDITRFLDAFPSLTRSTPELDNLSGTLSAEASGKMQMFPNMFVNVPSMTAEAGIDGSGIEFAREGNVSRITHLMMIRGDRPLTVDSIRIHGYFHDNLLVVEPFTVDCGPYLLSFSGVNNLQNEMYYHLGVVRSPLHFPFGVNIVGNRHHPEIRFGGVGGNDGREREIAANLKSEANVNIMRELRHGWLLFVETAAKYDNESNHSYVFNVE